MPATLMTKKPIVLRFDAKEIQARIPALRNDDNTSMFFFNELNRILTRERETKYPTLRARDFIPMNTEAGRGTETITFRSFTSVGLAKFIADYAKDFPMSDVFGKEGSVRIKSYGAGFQYNEQELRAASEAGRPLTAKRQSAASRAMRTLENKTAFLGNSAQGFTGFFKNPNVTVHTLTNDGAGSSLAWKDKTNDQIIRDFAELVNTPNEITEGVESVDTILLPQKALNLLKSRRMGNGDGTMTLYKYLSENFPTITIDWTGELNTAGDSSTTRAMAYRRDAEVVEMHLPQDLEFFPPQAEGMAWKVPAHARFGGVVFYYPLAALYADGI